MNVVFQSACFILDSGLLCDVSSMPLPVLQRYSPSFVNLHRFKAGVGGKLLDQQGFDFIVQIKRLKSRENKRLA